MSSVTGSGSGAVTTHYWYDADGNLLMQRDGPAAVLYLPGEDVASSGGNITATRYYLFGGQVVAAAAANPGGSKLVSWLFPDPLGTATADVSASTQVADQRYYAPSGVLLATTTSGSGAAAWPGTRGFAGGTADVTTGLTNLGAREYDPAVPGFCP